MTDETGMTQRLRPWMQLGNLPLSLAPSVRMAREGPQEFVTQGGWGVRMGLALYRGSH